MTSGYSRRAMLWTGAALAATVAADAGTAAAAESPDDASNVRSHGAVGDGRHDDSAAIQAALDAVGGHGTVVFPKGHYVVSRALRVHANQTLLGVGGFNGSVLVGSHAGDILSFVEIVGLHVHRMAFSGTNCTAIRQLDTTRYAADCHIHECHFHGNLAECLVVNLILSQITHSNFGTNGGGTPGRQHRHVVCTGVANANSANANFIGWNRFNRAHNVPAAVHVESGRHLYVAHNDFEDNSAMAIQVAGLFAVYFEGNWFERNRAQYECAIGNNSTRNLGTYIVDVSRNFFSPHHQITHLFGISGGVRSFAFIGNGGSRMKGKAVVYDAASKRTDEAFTEGHGNRLVGWVERLAPRSSDRLVASEWFRGWTVRDRQGWEKDLTQSTAWTYTESPGYAGSTIEYSHTANGPNFIYLSFPVGYYRGRTLALAAIGASLAGGDSFRLAINTTEVRPSDMREIGISGAFVTGEPQEINARVDVPPSARALHIGLRCAGRRGRSHILAFGAWVVAGEVAPMIGNS